MRLIDAEKLRKQMSEDYAQSISKISNPTVKAIVEKAVETFDGYVVSAETVEAIPVDWLLRKADWCDKNNGIFVSGAIRSAVDAWREEQNNGIDKP
jgi:hypothetical protein